MKESERERGSDDDSRVVDGRFHHGRELEGRVLHVPTLLGGRSRAGAGQEQGRRDHGNGFKRGAWQ